MSLNSFREKFARDIKTHGWTVVNVMADVERGVPSFSYTVGLSKAEHAELLISGLTSPVAHQILNTIAEKLINKEVAGVDREKITKAANAVLRFKTSGNDGLLFAKLAKQFADENMIALEVLQVQFPDQDGRFPDEPNCDPKMIMLQDLAALSVLIHQNSEDSQEPPSTSQTMH